MSGDGGVGGLVAAMASRWDRDWVVRARPDKLVSLAVALGVWRVACGDVVTVTAGRLPKRVTVVCEPLLPPGRVVLSTTAEEPEVAEDWAEARRLLAEDDGDEGDA